MKPTTDNHLEQMVEPLASYICAAGQPRSALLSALAVLFREVEQTNRAAVLHLTACSDSHGPEGVAADAYEPARTRWGATINAC